MAITIGTQLGAHEITELLGRGGFGEVYRARDTKLKREVAIKILPDEFSRDPERVARFQREAEVLASLNHPNIAGIYDLAEATGSRFLVLELVEGETLAERIERGPVPVDEALRIGISICEALEAAHEKDIVHRDLKPANVKITPEGAVKVLDFGLAKVMESASASTLFSNSPTLSLAATNAGVILGTAAYMAPEQARGRKADERSDIFSFGCVLYEMLTGKQAYQGEEVSDVLASILKSEPDFNLLPANLNPRLHELLCRCLEKNPKRRWQAAGDLRYELASVTAEPYRKTLVPPQAVTEAVRSRRRYAQLITVAVVFVAAILLSVWMTSIVIRPSAPPVVRLTATPLSPQRLASFVLTGSNDIAISPDGNHIVYTMGDSNTTQQIYVRAMDQLDAKTLPGIPSARDPFISPDSKWIGFWDGANLSKVAVNGGPAVTISKIEGNSRGATWGSDGRIIFATDNQSSGLLRVSAAGGMPEILTKPDAKKEEGDHVFPEILPGGRAVLFTITTRGKPAATNQIAVLDLATNTYKVLIQGGSNARYAASGHIVYGVEGTLRAVAFDASRLEVRGDPVPVVEHVVTKVTGVVDFSMSRDGSLVYIAGDSQNSGNNTLVWVDRQGHEEPLDVPPRAYGYVRISPDGTRAALDIRDQENDIWIWDFMRRTLTRLTFDPGLNRGIAWTPDGRRLAFAAQREGTENIYWQAADGTGVTERLTQDSQADFPLSFSPDGKHLVFNTGNSPPRQIAIVNLDGDHRVEPLIHTLFDEQSAAFSPDGRWIAYDSNESGRSEVYVRPFPDINSGRWQISVGGGTRPVWARNGHELFYYNPPKLMAAPIQPGSTFVAGNPQMLFEGPYFAALNGFVYDVSPDGRRFLMIKPVQPTGGSAASQLVVVLNWLEELKRLTRK
jgi:serine/threonine-protein kinase